MFPISWIDNLVLEHLPYSVHPIELGHIFQGPLPKGASLTQAWNYWAPVWSPNFFKRGLTMAVFHFEAKIPSLSDTFIIFVMVEITAGRICFSREVGIGSLSHDLVAIPFIIFFTSSSKTSLNWHSTSFGIVVDFLGSYFRRCPKESLIFWILCMKKSAKLFANSSSNSKSG